jgi:enoyl-CoA hydratase
MMPSSRLNKGISMSSTTTTTQSPQAGGELPSDGPTATQLVAAFRAFDADLDTAVAVLHCEGGVSCFGADIAVKGAERRNGTVA